MRLVLASSSPARLQTLRRAGVVPAVRAPAVDEEEVTAPDTAALVATLAELKGEAVLAELDTGDDLVVVACDSLLDVDGHGWGKPADAAEAGRRWRLLRGRSAVLLTGHHVVVVRDGAVTRADQVVRTTVHFADVSDAEVDAYVATGEPLAVAGAFTIDGYGAPFIERIEGDHLNVIGISLPVLRHLLAGLGVAWTDLWGDHAAAPVSWSRHD